MLILGIRGHADLPERFGSLFAESRWPVLIVHRQHDSPAGQTGQAYQAGQA
jgi:hypothetical protein